MAVKNTKSTQIEAKPFSPGVSGNPAGRPEGSKNHTTTLLKEAIMMAAQAVGEDGAGKDGVMGYCKFLAKEEPKAFASLMGKVLPMQIAGEFKVDVKDSLELLMEAVNGRTRSKP